MDAEHTGELLAEIASSASDDAGQGAASEVTPLHKSFVRLVEQFFSSAACLNAAFIDHKHSYQQESGSESPVRCPGERRVVGLLTRHQRCCSTMTSLSNSRRPWRQHLLLDLKATRALYDRLVKDGSPLILSALGSAIRQAAVKVRLPSARCAVDSKAGCPPCSLPSSSLFVGQYTDLNLEHFEDYAFLFILFECPLLLRCGDGTVAR